MIGTKTYGNLLSTVTKVTSDRGDPISTVTPVMSEDLLDVDHRTHDNWVVSRHEAAEVYSPEVHRHAETNPTCEIHKGHCASH